MFFPQVGKLYLFPSNILTLIHMLFALHHPHHLIFLVVIILLTYL